MIDGDAAPAPPRDGGLDSPRPMHGSPADLLHRKTPRLVEPEGFQVLMGGSDPQPGATLTKGQTDQGLQQRGPDPPAFHATGDGDEVHRPPFPVKSQEPRRLSVPRRHETRKFEVVIAPAVAHDPLVGPMDHGQALHEHAMGRDVFPQAGASDPHGISAAPGRPARDWPGSSGTEAT